MSNAIQSPNLRESPINEGKINYDPQANAQNFPNRNEAMMRNNLGGMPPCAEAMARKCCLDSGNSEKEGNKVQIDCEVFNREGNV